MGMKNKNQTFSIIDKELSIEGTVQTTGTILIKGSVKGTLVGGTVTISEEGVVYADTKVGSITIGGKFEGTIEASEELVVLSTGTCSGKAVCKDLVVKSGGILNAEVNCVIKGQVKPDNQNKEKSETKSEDDSDSEQVINLEPEISIVSEEKPVKRGFFGRSKD